MAAVVPGFGDVCNDSGLLRVQLYGTDANGIICFSRDDLRDHFGGETNRQAEGSCCTKLFSYSESSTRRSGGGAGGAAQGEY